ncbi:Fibroblast growth factor 17 [Halotydeus destructor]|nr:Fibroblast growth factor 17 [Halotydeus destructor]
MPCESGGPVTQLKTTGTKLGGGNPSLEFLLAILTALYLCHRSHMVQSSLVSKTGQRSKGTVRGQVAVDGSSRLLEGVRSKPYHGGRSGNHIPEEMTSTDKTTTPLSSSSPSITSGPTTGHKHRHGHELPVPAHATTARNFYLYNRCSGAYVHVTGKRISASPATTLDSQQYATMTLRRQAFGKRLGVTLQAKRAGTYLCFNKRGKLVTRFSGSSVNCLFTEIAADNNYIRFESVLNPDWALGFNRKGKPLHETINVQGEEMSPTSDVSRRLQPLNKKCYQFVKQAEPTMAATTGL